jgi:LAO/AO transport system kinase
MLEEELRELVLDNIESKVALILEKDPKFSELVESLARKEIDPYTAAERISANFIR